MAMAMSQHDVSPETETFRAQNYRGNAGAAICFTTVLKYRQVNLHKNKQTGFVLPSFRRNAA